MDYHSLRIHQSCVDPSTFCVYECKIFIKQDESLVKSSADTSSLSNNSNSPSQQNQTSATSSSAVSNNPPSALATAASNPNTSNTSSNSLILTESSKESPSLGQSPVTGQKGGKPETKQDNTPSSLVFQVKVCHPGSGGEMVFSGSDPHMPWDAIADRIYELSDSPLHTRKLYIYIHNTYTPTYIWMKISPLTIELLFFNFFNYFCSAHAHAHALS